MADQRNQFIEQVEQIEAALADKTVCVRWGESKLHTNPPNGEVRRVTFVPVGGSGYEQPQLSGVVEIENATVVTPGATGRHAKTRALTTLRVDAHIVAECFEVASVLHNNVIEASRQALKANSLPVGYEWISMTERKSAGLNSREEYVIQGFEWKLHTWQGIVKLPPPCEPVKTVVSMGDMQTVEAFTHSEPTPFEE